MCLLGLHWKIYKEQLKTNLEKYVRWTSNGKPHQLTEHTAGDVHRVESERTREREREGETEREREGGGREKGREREIS